MKRNASQRSSERSPNTGAQVQSHAPTFAKVLDGRKHPVRGLWQRGKRFYAQLSIEDFTSGEKRVRRVPLVNSDGDPVASVAQAIAELNRLRTQRSDDTMPKLGRTPTFAAYADEYLATIETGQGRKQPGTIAKEKGTLKLWKKHLGGIRLNKIRPAHVAGLMKKRVAAGMSRRTVLLDVITLRNVLKQARDTDEYIAELPVPPGINRQLKSVPPKRKLFTPGELDVLCRAALDKGPDGKAITKNGQELADYVKLMAFCGARRNEALALRWADADFQKEQLTIERQASKKEKDELPKNLTARTVNFNPALKKHLLDMRTRRAPDSQWLFPSPQRGDKDIHAMSFRKSLELARAHAKLRRVGFHDMRHLFCSFCVMSGIDYMTVAAWVGHRDGGILIGKVYGHLTDAHTKAAARRVSFGPEILDIASEVLQLTDATQ
jgi:integrase